VRRSARIPRLLMGLSVLGIAAGCSSAPAPAQPAEAVKGEGLKNTFQVAPGVLRGGQPTKEGMKTLEDRGVRTVINLRAEASDGEAVEGRALKVVDVPMKTWKADHDTLAAFLRALGRARAEGTCFFH
jgi:hypothetical protein